jgi:hypothetical protein
MSKKKLPPLPAPDDPVLLAIKQAHKQPQPLSEEEAREFIPSEGLILRGPGARLLKRRGKLIWRKMGKAGADLDRPPLAVECDRAQQRYETDLSKIERLGRAIRMRREASKKGILARQQKAKEMRATVLQLTAQHANKGRNLASFIAKRLGITPQRVRQILAEEKRK